MMFAPSEQWAPRPRQSMKKDISKQKSSAYVAPNNRPVADPTTRPFQYEHFIEAVRREMEKLIIEQYWLKQKWRKVDEEFTAALVSLQKVIIDHIEELERQKQNATSGPEHLDQVSNYDQTRKKMEEWCNYYQGRLAHIIEDRHMVDVRRVQLLEIYRREQRKRYSIGFETPKALSKEPNLAILAKDQSEVEHQLPDEANTLEMYRKSSTSKAPINCQCPHCKLFGIRNFENFKEHSAHLTKVYTTVAHTGYYRCASLHCAESETLWLFRDSFEAHAREAHPDMDQLYLIFSSLYDIPKPDYSRSNEETHSIMKDIDDIISSYTNPSHETQPSMTMKSTSGSTAVSGQTTVSGSTAVSESAAAWKTQSAPSSRRFSDSDSIVEIKAITEKAPYSGKVPISQEELELRDIGTSSTDSEQLPSMTHSTQTQVDAKASASPDFKLPHFFPHHDSSNSSDLRRQLPEWLQWDVEHGATSSRHRHWTYTPSDPDCKEGVPLTIAQDPVVVPVDHRWPPISGVIPPPDPKRSSPIDCAKPLPIAVVRDLFRTFYESLGFYILINGLIQIIVREDFNTEWAASHLPHKYGGLKISYIKQSLDPTMLPRTEGSQTDDNRADLALRPSALSRLSSVFRQTRPVQPTPVLPSTSSLQLNDFIEAKPKSSRQRERFAGRVGLKVEKDGEQYLIMSTHVIVEAILAKSFRRMLFGSRASFQRLHDNWNQHVEIRAKNARIGSIFSTMDPNAGVYPDGFSHDISLIAPLDRRAIQGVMSPISGLGWLSQQGFSSLRRRSNPVKFLESGAEHHRQGRSIRTSSLRDVMIVGEGIFANQSEAPKQLRESHDPIVWEQMVSRALLYRVYPDFDPPNGQSGTALYADGLREDGSTGPGVIGFQSFVQRSGHVQNFDMDGEPLENRLRRGRVAFYGAFPVPKEVRTEYTIV